MKNILFLILLISNIGFAQVFNDYNFNTEYSDQLTDITEYETGYLLTGYISDSAYSATYSIHGATALIKLSKTGNPIDTFTLDTFGVEIAYKTVYYNNYFYVFGTTNPDLLTDTFYLIVTKMDTNFNVIQQRQYPELEGISYLSIFKTKYTADSSMYFIGYNYHGSFNYNGMRSFLFNYNFDNMEMITFDYISQGMLVYDVMIYNNPRKYTFSGIYDFLGSKFIGYDSLLNKTFDTNIPAPEYNNAVLGGYVYFQEYRDSLYLCLGKSIIHYPSNNPTCAVGSLVLEVLDSNYNIVDYKYWFNDTLTIIETSIRNGLLKNNDNEYFVGGTIGMNYYYMDSGIVIIKIDSNLNTIWRKHIECTARTMRLMNMHPTDDGGVLILYEEQASITGAELKNSKLMKIGPNGEVISIINLGKQISKQAVNIYPNPATTEINISLKQANEGIARLSIIDIQGKVVIQKQVGDKQTKLDVSALSSGIYIVEGYTSLGVKFTSKFVKK
ncbi:MAG: hypothetical protein B6I18_05105 [Bacteroidetes bacterium 4572_112]|nr:MAG: hypothetical protein B6I18_05105 [Bacteroidetes bacterium 4572_112]